MKKERRKLTVDGYFSLYFDVISSTRAIQFLSNSDVHKSIMLSILQYSCCNECIM